MARRPKLLLALAFALAAPTLAAASDLPEQRQACQEEARRHIRGPSRVDLDLYKRVVDRRLLYVQDCMLNGPEDVGATGSVTVPLPPRRPIA
jgi:hypothetical protein